MKITGGLDKKQHKQLREALSKRDLQPKQRQRLLWRIAKLGIIKAAVRHQRNQADPNGNPWPKRKRGKKKMLRQLPKLMHVKELPEHQAVRIYFKGGHYKNGNKAVAAGLIGAVQQYGASFTMNASQAPRPDQRGLTALPRQAKKLRKLGYKRWNGKRYVPVPSKIIIDTMSRAQAGLLIRKLSQKPAKTRWQIDIPARVFLGVSDDELNQILARQLQAIGFGWDVKAQDIKGKQ
ncbi:hypothetical protein [Photorhabdus tasmaniensis]|uniref:Phage protein n=1 Tax=Photorhabdus tasmaniensis TaxID=1004159 RepID=A0ABX0GDN1_9GAMM|nr:hypothetical protein [Photorhabdus tasmaniensis]NHB87184.1 hypothetical protein [Photorhabdus tasmaniensis]